MTKNPRLSATSRTPESHGRPVPPSLGRGVGATNLAYGARPIVGAGAALLAFAALFMRRDVLQEIVGAAAGLLGASLATAALILAVTIQRRVAVAPITGRTPEAP